MGIWFYEGSLLFDNGQLAMSKDCCCGAENTCNGCDPPIPDTLYVTFPSGLSGDFAPYARNTYALPHYLGCEWLLDKPEGGDGVTYIEYGPDLVWYIHLEAITGGACEHIWADPSKPACDLKGSYPHNSCYGFGCDNYTCGQDDSIDNATVSYL